jgi:uncharacterized membrane protein
MTHHQFTTKEVLSFAFGKTKEHYWPIAKIAVVSILISGAAMLIPLFNGVVNGLITLSLVSVSLAIAKGHAPVFHQMLRPFDSYKIIWHSFLATLLYILMVALGLILLVLPGIYLSVRLKFYIYFIVEDENLKPTDALRKSMDLSRGLFWKLFAFNIILAAINILGFLALGIGLLFTIPLSLIAYAHLYKHLSLHKEEHHHTSPHIA